MDSEPGKGSCFWFELPFERVPLEPGAAHRGRLGVGRGPFALAESMADPGAPRRVLLAEDNEIDREVAREMIAASGCECDCVANAHEAIRAVRERGYDLVFMDCMMPGLDGYAATQAIRAEEGRGRGRPRRGSA
ncbi:MAG: response regulator [Verrucomicrobiales bacterium]|nr:response regulator [Verrucomicrobiales bacterium]